MFVFGVLALLLGLLGLIRPQMLLSILGFTVLDRAARLPGDYTLVFMIASALASFNIGAYYILAALHDLKPFYKWTAIFRYQDFSRHFYNSAAVKAELDEVQKVVTSQPKDSVLVLSDFRDTSVGSDLLSSMNAASNATKAYVHKTAVLGVTGMKRRLADLLTALTGQPLKYFDDIESAKNWLVEE